MGESKVTQESNRIKDRKGLLAPYGLFQEILVHLLQKVVQGEGAQNPHGLFL